MGGCYLLKYNGGDSGIKISVLYWRCSLIRVSVIRGSTVVNFDLNHLVITSHNGITGRGVLYVVLRNYGCSECVDAVT
jgi:hypothetical protein